MFTYLAVCQVFFELCGAEFVRVVQSSSFSAQQYVAGHSLKSTVSGICCASVPSIRWCREEAMITTFNTRFCPGRREISIGASSDNQSSLT